MVRLLAKAYSAPCLMGQRSMGCLCMSKRMGTNRCGTVVLHQDGALAVITLMGHMEYRARKVISALRMFAAGPTMIVALVVVLPTKMPLSGVVTVRSTQPKTNA